MKRARGRPRAKHDRKVTWAGYVIVRVGRVWRLEHRVILERIWGTPLPPGTRVRHRNGDRADNRPENLDIVLPRALSQFSNEVSRATEAGVMVSTEQEEART